jgi:hypothetical protein
LGEVNDRIAVGVAVWEVNHLDLFTVESDTDPVGECNGGKHIHRWSGFFIIRGQMFANVFLGDDYRRSLEILIALNVIPVKMSIQNYFYGPIRKGFQSRLNLLPHPCKHIVDKQNAVIANRRRYIPATKIADTIEKIDILRLS